MKQFFTHYEKWEDFKNGMYSTELSLIEKSIPLAINILGNADVCRIAMDMALSEWPISSKLNLTNPSINRIAWLGWASCSIYAKSPKLATCMAWKQLTRKQQREANKIAYRLIKVWEMDYCLSKQFKLEFYD